MINHLTADKLRHIVNGGGSVEVDGSRYTSENLRHVANGLKAGAHLKVCNCEKFPSETLRHIANGACEGATVIFC